MVKADGLQRQSIFGFLPSHDSAQRQIAQSTKQSDEMRLRQTETLMRITKVLEHFSLSSHELFGTKTLM
jgi:hypothetical protein